VHGKIWLFHEVNNTELFHHSIPHRASGEFPLGQIFGSDCVLLPAGAHRGDSYPGRRETPSLCSRIGRGLPHYASNISLKQQQPAPCFSIRTH